MVELLETWGRVLGALLGGLVAWRTPGDLAGALGWDEQGTNDVLALLDVDGWLDVWEIDDGPFVTLSALGAARLRVRLVEAGEGQVPRWAPAGDPEPARPRAKHVCTHQRAADLAFLVDPHPTPDQVAERADRPDSSPSPSSATGPGVVAEPWPFPTLLLGQGLSPWPGPGRDPGAPCPACGGRAIRPHAYCLYCDRWGLDGRFATARPASSPRRSRLAQPGEPAPGRAGRARRKTRRRHRRRDQEEAGRARDRRGPGGGRAGGPSGDGPPLA